MTDQRIWNSFNDVAEPSKIIEFLKDLGYGVELVIEKNIFQKTLQSNPDKLNLYSYVRTLFKADEIVEKGVTEETFAGSSGFLMCIGDFHVVLGKKSENGSIQFYDPNFKLCNEFKSAKELIDACEESGSRVIDVKTSKPMPDGFSGVGFRFFRKDSSTPNEPVDEFKDDTPKI